jgi:predicted nucleic acid-binding protein
MTYGALRLDRRVGFAPEPNEFPETWQAFTAGPRTSPNLWTDAYLCAFANAAQLTLVTFDAKIPAREDVCCLLLR